MASDDGTQRVLLPFREWTSMPESQMTTPRVTQNPSSDSPVSTMSQGWQESGPTPQIIGHAMTTDLSTTTIQQADYANHHAAMASGQTSPYGYNPDSPGTSPNPSSHFGSDARQGQPRRLDDKTTLLREPRTSAALDSPPQGPPPRGFFHSVVVGKGKGTTESPPPSYTGGKPLYPDGRSTKTLKPRRLGLSPFTLQSWENSAWSMILFFLFGLACAVAHHVFYCSLDGKPADDQIRMLRYGTLLAFAAKGGLSAAVIVAFRQRLWRTVRQRLLTVAAVDSLFAATENVVGLMNWELIRNAWVAIALAFYVW